MQKLLKFNTWSFLHDVLPQQTKFLCWLYDRLLRLDSKLNSKPGHFCTMFCHSKQGFYVGFMIDCCVLILN